MNNKIKKITLFFLLILITLVLVSAYIIEYKLGYQPCKLCIYQRIPYFFSILLIANLIFVKKHEKITYLILFLVFAFSSVLAFYHFGIEQGFFNESFLCSIGDQFNTLSKEEILEQFKQNSIGCRDGNFKIFGVSLATINTIFSLILSVIFIRLFLSYGKN